MQIGDSNPFFQIFGSLMVGISAVWAVISYLIGLACTFVVAGIIHLSAMLLLKGKGDYNASYKAISYSSAPSLLLGWIPILI